MNTADFHPTSISHPVVDLAGAREFMTEALGFALSGSGDAWALLDNGSLAIRLVKADDGGAPPLRVELLTQDVDATVNQLGTRPEVGARGELGWPSPDRCEVALDVGGWLTLVVFRVYDEDERGVLPKAAPSSTGYPPKSCEITSLVTHKRFVEAALAGRKTQQRRDGLYAYPNETFTLDDVLFRVTAVERQRLGDITEDDARREGFPGLGAYKDLILRMHAGMPWDEEALVWVHSFERVSGA
jgi:hypothetical protein